MCGRCARGWYGLRGIWRSTGGGVYRQIRSTMSSPAALVLEESAARRCFSRRAGHQVCAREIERLPKENRDVLLLSAMDELRTAEIAKVVGRSESSVRSLLFRARARLRERLEKG